MNKLYSVPLLILFQFWAKYSEEHGIHSVWFSFNCLITQALQQVRARIVWTLHGHSKSLDSQKKKYDFRGASDPPAKK